MGEPAPLRRRDGASVYTGHDTTVYTSTAVLAAERRILAAAAQRGGRVVDDASIGLALLEATRPTRCDAQRRPDRAGPDMATSGARVQLALAPAGTGKTTAMAALAAAWRNSGGTVIGLAPTASAAEVLAADLGSATDTIAKLVQLAKPADQHRPPTTTPPGNGSTPSAPTPCSSSTKPAWRRTCDLDAVIGHALATGASVRLIGDDQQLASISAGGVLRDIADRARRAHPEHGRAVHRPGARASRRGRQPGAARRRSRRASRSTSTTTASMSAPTTSPPRWPTTPGLADLAAGRDAILLAPTNELVAQLNERARLDRLAHRAPPRPPRQRSPSATA